MALLEANGVYSGWRDGLRAGGSYCTASLYPTAGSTDGKYIYDSEKVNCPRFALVSSRCGICLAYFAHRSLCQRLVASTVRGILSSAMKSRLLRLPFDCL